MGTVFLTEMYGLMSNNFYQHVFFDSFCREHGIKFVNPHLQRYYKDYPNLNEHKRSKFRDYLTRKIIKKLRKIGWIKVESFDDISKQQSYFAEILKSEKLYCKGWAFVDVELVEKYRSVYQNLFAPDVDVADLEKRYLTRSHKEQITLAVHVRRGDYKEHLGGIYYFEDDVYIRKIQEFLLALHKDCKIIIFTNDQELDLETYVQHFPNVILSNNSAKIDHYLMSKCDYIIGALSTFSMWAGYMGNVPYYHIKDPKAILTLDAFLTVGWS